MALKGRKPAIIICGSVCLYQGSGGISRGYLVVRVGALNSICISIKEVNIKKGFKNLESV
jgi:hypothetical protein